MFRTKKLRERARLLRDWGRGISKHDQSIHSRLATYRIDGKPYDSAFVFLELGYNFKPTEMQAAFGLKQLERLESFVERRARTFSRLVSFFKHYEDVFILPKPAEKCRVNWLAFPLTVAPGAPFTRNQIVRYLEEHRIQTRPLFSGNIVKHPAYQSVRSRRVGSLPQSQMILERSFVIGVHHGITDAMIAYECEVFEKFFQRFRK